MNATEVMLEAAERKWKEIGERHGYTGVAYGLAEVLRQHGLDVDGKELSAVFHDPLADFHSAMEKGAITYDDVARAMDVTRGNRHQASLPYPFDRILSSGQFPSRASDVRSPRVDMGWAVK